ncbi:DoxX family protein [Nocardia beijingensis]|uniref:DoxX family protein n=1 Tax=Nocardia beijingensis TaxID=95162 RepID=UPI00082CABB0|nr:DoxX family protein [Nocardia beijingensis]
MHASPVIETAPEVPARESGTSTHIYDAGLAVLRLGVGLTMAAHGSQKLFGWFGGGGIDGTRRFFTGSGYPIGKTMAVIAGLSETLGGIALAVGFLTPLAAAAVVGVLVNAIAVKWGGGFFAPKGVEYELVLALAATSIALTGPGAYAVDRMVPGLRPHRLGYGISALLLALVTAGAALLVRS